MNPQTKPAEYPGAVPYLNVDDGVGALEFYLAAFGAVERARILRKDGPLAHGEFTIEGSPVMVREEIPEMGFLNPRRTGGTPTQVMVFVSDVEAFTARAVEAGAELVAPVTQQFHGDLMSILRDPFGHEWFFATRVESIARADLADRAREWGI